MKKTYKLDHHLAEQIRQGLVTSIWRIYDDNNIVVNDEVGLIDKVDPSNPETWIEIGIARVDMVIEKRLGDIDAMDTRGWDSYLSREVLLGSFKEDYGPEVTYETPVKIIHFTLKKLKNIQQSRAPTLKEAKMYADGGSRGNPGPSATGYVLLDMDNQTVVKNGTYLGITTNNQAEYQALKSGLEEALRLNVRTLHVYMDSMLVINQMKGIFKVKNRDLWPIYESIKALSSHFEHITFTHVPRELNKLADGMVNEVLDAAERYQ